MGHERIIVPIEALSPGFKSQSFLGLFIEYPFLTNMIGEFSKQIRFAKNGGFPLSLYLTAASRVTICVEFWQVTVKNGFFEQEIDKAGILLYNKGENGKRGS